MTCMCTGRCKKPPYTCSGIAEPDFLTDQQRQAHEEAYRRGETRFSAPFEPWVVRSWAEHLDKIGGFAAADRVREAIKTGVHREAVSGTRKRSHRLSRK